MTFDPLRREVIRRTERAVAAAAREAHNDLQRGPYKTGRLVAASRARAKGTTIEIEVDVPYAEYVRYGTRPHIIRGRPLLSFYWARMGKHMVLPFVRHPGTQPNPWYDRVLNSLTDNVRKYLRGY